MNVMQETLRGLEAKLGIAELTGARRHFRNTHDAFASVRGQDAVIKVTPSLSGEAGTASIATQRDIIASFQAEDRSRISGIIEHWPDLGAVALEQVRHPSVAAMLTKQGRDRQEVGKMFGKALRFFHDRSTLSQPAAGKVLMHLDFSPNNVM